MARLPSLRRLRDPQARDAVQRLQEHQEAARRAHRGIFEYGDPGDSDDDEAGAGAGPRGGGGRGGGGAARGGRR